MEVFLQGHLKHQLWTIQCYPRYWDCILLVPTEESLTHVLFVYIFVDRDLSNSRRFYHQEVTVSSVNSHHRAIWLYHVQNLQPMMIHRSKARSVWSKSACQYRAAVGSDSQLGQVQRRSCALTCLDPVTPTANVTYNTSPIHLLQLHKEYCTRSTTPLLPLLICSLTHILLWETLSGLTYGQQLMTKPFASVSFASGWNILQSTANQFSP